MMIEILFLGPDTTCAQATPIHQFQLTANIQLSRRMRFTMQKVMKKYRKKHDDMMDAQVTTLHGMIGKSASSIETNEESPSPKHKEPGISNMRVTTTQAHPSTSREQLTPTSLSTVSVGFLYRN